MSRPQSLTGIKLRLISQDQISGNPEKIIYLPSENIAEYEKISAEIKIAELTEMNSLKMEYKEII